MIIREWRCRARQSEAAKYPDYFRSEVIPELRKVQGFAGGFLSQRESGEFDVLEELSPREMER
jgi:hypothetical protein